MSKYLALLLVVLTTLFIFCTKVDFDSIVDDLNNGKTDKQAPYIFLGVDNPDYVIVNSVDNYTFNATAFDTVKDLNDTTNISVVNYSADINIENNVNTSKIDTYYVYLSVSDAAGNTAYDTLKVIVSDSTDIPEKDTIAPIVTLIGPSTIQHTVNTPYTDPGAVAIDDVDDTVDVQTSGLDGLNTSQLGTFKIGYWAVDNSGNVSDTVLRYIFIVEDTDNDPEITISGKDTIKVELGKTYTAPEVTAFDLEDEDLTDSIKISGDNVNVNEVGTYLVIYSVTDSDENTVSDTLVVIVYDNSQTDTVAPVIVIAGDNPLSVDSGGSYSHPSVTANDNIDGDVSSSIDTTGDEVNTDVLGTYKVIFTATDGDGNIGKDTLVVNVVSTSGDDKVPPVISISGDNPLSVDSGGSYSHPSVTANDDVDGDVSSSIDTTGDEVNTDVLGTYEVIFTATDVAGNVGRDTLVVNVISVSVEDTVPPVISISGDNPLSVDSGGSYTHPSVTANDNVDGNVSSSIDTIGDNVDPNTVGTYKVIFTAQDAAGNVGKDTLVVNVVAVVDTVPPTITISGDNPLSVDSGGSYSHPSVTANDDVDGDVSSSIDTVGDSVDPNAIGTYNVIFTAQDAAGNIGRDTLVVNVKSTSAPDTVEVTTSGNKYDLSKTTVYIIPSITSNKILQIEAGAAAITVTEYDKQGAVEGPVTIESYQNRLFNAWGDEVIIVEPSGATYVRFTWW